MNYNKISLIVCALAVGLLAACAPTKSQIQDLLEKNPDILVGAIQKHPNQIMEALQKAAMASQQQQQQKAEQEEQTRMDNEFKHPLEPTLPKDRAYFGPEDAPITIVEYTDFQCPFCQRAYQTLQQVEKAYPGKIRLLYKSFPLTNIHEYAMDAAKRFEAIALQNKAAAYKYYDDVFQHRDELLKDGTKFLDRAAKQAGANVAKMKKDMDGKVVSDRIKADTSEAEKFGFTGTPGFIISGVSVRGAYPFDTFKQIIDKKLGGGSK